VEMSWTSFWPGMMKTAYKGELLREQCGLEGLGEQQFPNKVKLLKVI